MKTLTVIIPSVTALLSLCLAAHAGTTNPYLTDGSANFIATGAEQNGDNPWNPTFVLANGLTMGAIFSPDASDLTSSTTGAVQIMEIGGSTSGSGLYIMNGNITYITKSGAANGFPTSYSDLDGTDGNIAYSFGSLSAGVSYDVWASLDTANSQLILSLNDTITTLSLASVTSTWNWAGANTAGLDFGLLDAAGAGRLGGLSNNTGGGLFYTGNAVALSGTATEAEWWNSPTVVPVPEPSVAALGGLGMALATMVYRKKR